jgi:SAM-dependent methyltransferase
MALAAASALDAPHHVDRALRTARATMRAFADIIDRSRSAFGDPWTAEFGALVGALFPEDAALEAALQGYSRFVRDSMRLQAAFERTGRYQSSSYAEAAARVYHNEGYMMSQYLPGLLLSHYLWPHHYRQLLFFDAAFVRQLRDTGVARFAEVGVGTGIYSRRILGALPGATGVGYDISPSAQRFATRHLDACGVGHRYALELRDVLAHPPAERFPAVVCVEVLEHLEDPVAFLAGVRQLLAPGGTAFITAAVNADHADHIYLYRSAAEVEAHVRAAGFVVEQGFQATAYAPQQAHQPIPVAAAFIAR